MCSFILYVCFVMTGMFALYRKWYLWCLHWTGRKIRMFHTEPEVPPELFSLYRKWYRKFFYWAGSYIQDVITDPEVVYLFDFRLMWNEVWRVFKKHTEDEQTVVFIQHSNCINTWERQTMSVPKKFVFVSYAPLRRLFWPHNSMKYMLNIFQILLLLYAFVDSFVHHDSNKLALKVCS